MSSKNLIRNLALISESPSIRFKEVAVVAAALNKQAVRDFGPIWNIDATVDAFEELEDMPIGYWPLIIRDNINAPGAAGYHSDNEGQPFSLIQSDTNWSLTASHEMLEMLADPLGSRVTAGPSPMKEQGRVEFLVEVSDPCESEACAYTVNDVTVSDFYTPEYFEPVAAPGVRYDFTGKISKPRQVLPGGYLSWHDPDTDHWWQEQLFDVKPVFKDLGVFTASATMTLREWIDSKTPQPFERLRSVYQSQRSMTTAVARMMGSSALTPKSRAARLRKLIAKVTGTGSAAGGAAGGKKGKKRG